MRNRTTYWAVTHSERDPQTGLGALIPTKGNPTSASDMYRVLGYTQTGHEGWNSCFTDVNTCVSLARIIEGKVGSWDDINAAETALQLLMWHDRVDVLIPAFKQESGSLKPYVRCDPERSQLSFELFNPLQPHDQMYVIEKVLVEDGIIKSSNYRDSSIIEVSVQEASKTYLNTTELQASALSSIALDFGVPAYLTEPRLESNFDKAGYFSRLYKALRSDWYSSHYMPPEIESSVRLPPLIAIVLSRASNRDSIPQAIFQLREELNPVRREILRLNEVIAGPYNQVELEQEWRRRTQSFEAIFAASRYQGSKVILPLLKLYKAFRKPVDELIKIFNPYFKSDDPSKLANRTVTGRIFSNLLVTDSMHCLLLRRTC